MRRLARLLPYGIILLLIAAAVVVLLRAGQLSEYARMSIQKELTRQLGRSVTIGSASLSLSGEVVLHDVVVRNEDDSILFRSPVIDARVGRPGNPIALLSSPTDLRSIRLSAPELTLTRDDSGVWNIGDIIARRGKRPSRFRGTVEVDEATIVIVDHMREGLTTTISGADVSVTPSDAGAMAFAIRASENESAFLSLDLKGETDAESGATRVGGRIEGLHLPYLVARLPEFKALAIPAGVAGVTGEVEYRPNEDEGVALEYDITADVVEGEAEFPWLRQPVEEVQGRFRFHDGDLHISGARGALASAPVSVDGVIHNLSSPELALDVKLSGIRYPQLRALLPGLALPVGLVLPSPLRLTAEVTGPAKSITVKGEAAVKVITFHTIPWHDLATRFEYSNGRLTIAGLNAHGSPRRIEADVELDLRKKAAGASGQATLVNVPLDMLATMAGIEGEFGGVVRARVSGRIDDVSEGSGDFEVAGATVRGVELGDIAGRFEYADGRLRLSEVAVRGPTAEGSIDAELALPDSYRVEARLVSLDLSRLGPALRLEGLEGRCCAMVEASGLVSEGMVSGRLGLGPGVLQGRTFQSLAADFSVSRTEVAVSDLSLALDDGRCTGGFRISNLGSPSGQIALEGRLDLTQVPVVDLLADVDIAFLSNGSLNGSVEVGGSLADPTLAADLKLDAISVGGQAVSIGRLQAQYRAGELFLQEANIEVAGGRLQAAGGYSQQAGLSIEIAGDGVELAQIADELRTRYGIAVEGILALRASLTGSLAQPRVEFAVKASPVSANQVEFDEISVLGAYEDHAVQIDKAELLENGSATALSGRVNLADRAIDARLQLDDVRLSSLMWIGDRAAWRLYRMGVRTPLFRSYAKIPRPLDGTLTGALVVSGSPDRLSLEARLNLANLGFNGKEVERIRADGLVQLRPEARSLRLENAEVDIEATHELAVASLAGTIDGNGGTFLVLDVGNLDLRLLSPWLGLPVDLGGTATINFDVTGAIRRPVLRGDIFVDNFRAGTLSLEATTLGPIRMEEGTLSLEQIRLRDGPMEGSGQAIFPLQALGIAQGELHLRDASFTAFQGLTPAEFDADIYLAGNKILLQDGEGRQGAGAEPGVRGKLGQGAFSVGGEVVLTTLRLKDWNRNTFDVRLELDNAGLSFREFVQTRLNGALVLTNDPKSGEALVMSPPGNPILVSDATIGLPKAEFPHGEPSPILGPGVNVRLLVGENVKFRHGSDRRPTEIVVSPGSVPDKGAPTGYLDLTGNLSAKGLRLEGEIESTEGQLAFPNGILTLQRAKAWMNRRPGKSPIVTVSGEMSGRVGDYYVSLSPTGQIFPLPSESDSEAMGRLALNASAIPPLEEAYVLALLVGPVIAPTRRGQSDMATILSDPTRVSNDAEITGVMLPAFGGVEGTPELGIDVERSGQVRLRIGQRLNKRLIITYISALSGPSEPYDLRFSYEVTPRWLVGWGVNERDQGRWEVQSFIPF